MRTTQLILLVGFLVLNPAARAGDPRSAPDPAKLVLTTDRVVVFKDGYALFVKSATATADDRGRAYSDRVPDAAVLGCFWAAAEDGRALTMRAEWVESTTERATERPCLNMVELLRVNAGRTLTLELRDRGRLSGTIVELLERRPADGPNAQAPAGGDFVVVDEAQSGRIVLPVGDIHRILGDARTVITEVVRATERTKRLTIELGASAAGKPVKLKLFHFQPGVRWIPTYRLTGIDPGPGKLSLQAEVLNEAEDIEGAALDLVVGVPNFRFKDVVSPLSLEAALRNSLEQAAPGLMRQQLAQVQFQNRAGESQRDDRGGDVPALPGEITGTGEQDLFVYSLGSFTLKRGARAAIPVWESDAPLRHLYTVDMPIIRDGDGGSDSIEIQGSDAGSPLRRLKHKVWHQLELTNPGRAPWTTGAALVMQGMLPIAQELLLYTSAGGGRTLLPLTVAVDVRAEYEEAEIARQPNALRWNGDTYILVSKRATLTLTNHRTEPIATRIRVSVGGLAEEASDSGRIDVDDFHRVDWAGSHAGRVNNHSDVTWDLTLKPGESKTLTYGLKYYVP